MSSHLSDDDWRDVENMTHETNPEDEPWATELLRLRAEVTKFKTLASDTCLDAGDELRRLRAENAELREKLTGRLKTRLRDLARIDELEVQAIRHDAREMVHEFTEDVRCMPGAQFDAMKKDATLGANLRKLDISRGNDSWCITRRVMPSKTDIHIKCARASGEEGSPAILADTLDEALAKAAEGCDAE